MKNGAELLDRLIKDIVSESAASYVSILSAEKKTDSMVETKPDGKAQFKRLTTFSLPRFIPLLQERIHVINPFTRIFLVNWIILLDSVPDLELVSYLPSFLKGIFRFLSDPNQEVHTATQGLLNRFLNEVRKIARVKKSIATSRGTKNAREPKSSSSSMRSASTTKSGSNVCDEDKKQAADHNPFANAALEDESDGSESHNIAEDLAEVSNEDWLPGQDIHIEYRKILEILVALLPDPSGRIIFHSHCSRGH